jgi:hypothetical protein
MAVFDITTYRDGGTLGINGSFIIEDEWVQYIFIDYNAATTTPGLWYHGDRKAKKIISEVNKKLILEQVLEYKNHINTLINSVINS